MLWRVLRYQNRSAADNMAIDAAMLESHLRGLTPPTLRFYGWTPPAVSYGYNQVLPEETVARIKAEGLDVVRRPTGGRAVLHMGEFTYSFVGSSSTQEFKKGFLSSTISEAYRQICNGLQGGLSRLGVEVEIGKTQAAYRQQEDCFLATTSADLHYNGKKIVGSAQLRRKHAVLQHGSLLLDQPQDLMPRLLGANTVGGAERHANLFEIIPRCDIERIEIALIAGFSEAFGVEFEEGEITFAELASV